MALGWLVILVGATVHPGDLAYLQGTPLKRKMSIILGNWDKKSLSAIEMSANSTILASIYI